MMLSLGFVILMVMKLSGAASSVYTDAPPVITHPPNLSDPASENLRVVVTYYDPEVVLKCTAENADEVYWKFLKSETSEPSDLPTSNSRGNTVEWKETSHQTKGLTVEISFKVGGTGYQLAHDIAGYYQCFASNPHGYTTVTPPIRLIAPVVFNEQSDTVVFSGDQPAVVSVDGVEEKPYAMKCLDNLVLKPDDYKNIYYNDRSAIKFEWKIHNPNAGDGEPSETAVPDHNDDKEKARIRVDEKTGVLYFAYLEPDDASAAKSYKCNVVLAGSTQSVTVRMVQLTVKAASTTPAEQYSIQYPEAQSDSSTTCIEQRPCYLSCVFGGRKMGSDGKFVPPPPVEFSQRECPGCVAERRKGPSFFVFTGIPDGTGEWQCGLIGDSTSTTSLAVLVLEYPELKPGAMVNQFVPANIKVIFSCAVTGKEHHTTRFFYNGTSFDKAVPDFVTFRDGSNIFTIEKVKREHSSSISCMSTNDAGSMFRTAQLNVYTPPEVILEPTEGHVVPNNVSEVINYDFTCMVAVDDKSTNITVHWNTTNSQIKGYVKHGFSQQSMGVNVDTSKSEKRDGKIYINSTLTLRYDLITQSLLEDHKWQCHVYFDIPAAPIGSLPQKYSRIATFGIEAEPAPVAIQKAFPYWIIGAVLAVLFFILLVLLIICCVRKNKGEQYYVDEKERKAGHNPEQELETYGFQDYKRPAAGGYIPVHFDDDQNPIKGSRASMEISDKPMESDTGSMDEYGDIDTGRFNEDGSFIGQYGQRRNQADV